MIEWLPPELDVVRQALLWLASGVEESTWSAQMIGAALSTLGTLVAAAIAAWVAYQGPKAQRAIAADQLRLGRQQMKFQRRQAAAQLANENAQAWADGMRDRVSEAIAIVTDLAVTSEVIAVAPSDSDDLKRELKNRVELQRRYSRLAAEIELSVGNEYDRLMLMAQLKAFRSVKGTSEEFSRVRAATTKLAIQIIEHRLERVRMLLALDDDVSSLDAINPSPESEEKTTEGQPLERAGSP